MKYCSGKKSMKRIVPCFQFTDRKTHPEHSNFRLKPGFSKHKLQHIVMQTPAGCRWQVLSPDLSMSSVFYARNPAYG
jgi:hypothetical protein